MENPEPDGPNYVVQYFERARMEHRPEWAGTERAIRLTRLGTAVYAESVPAPASLPSPPRPPPNSWARESHGTPAAAGGCPASSSRPRRALLPLGEGRRCRLARLHRCRLDSRLSRRFLDGPAGDHASVGNVRHGSSAAPSIARRGASGRRRRGSGALLVGTRVLVGNDIPEHVGKDMREIGAPARRVRRVGAHARAFQPSSPSHVGRSALPGGRTEPRDRQRGPGTCRRVRLVGSCRAQVADAGEAPGRRSPTKIKRRFFQHFAPHTGRGRLAGLDAPAEAIPADADWAACSVEEQRRCRRAGRSRWCRAKGARRSGSKSPGAPSRRSVRVVATSPMPYFVRSGWRDDAPSLGQPHPRTDERG